MKHIKKLNEYNNTDNSDEFVEGFLNGYYSAIMEASNLFAGKTQEQIRLLMQDREDEIREEAMKAFATYNKKGFNYNQQRIPYTKNDKKWNGEVGSDVDEDEEESE